MPRTATLLQKISLSINSRDHIVIQDDNPSGKSTLIKAILNDISVIKKGNSHVPKIGDIAIWISITMPYPLKRQLRYHIGQC